MIDKKMSKNRIYKYVGRGLLALLLLALITFLNIAVQKNTTISNENSLKANQQTKLNVAIVNEDKPVYMDTKEYNLGASYVKNIERDNSQNWFVVPRGTADAGLESGKYQLVLTIPSDFSQKVLDINNINVDKTIVNYKINAQGNLQVENDANKLAKDIVADLNGQLVDMYMASILSNLYTAQKNVQASAQLQSTNIESYRNNVFGTALNSKNLFPNLYSLSNSTVESNSALKTGLESYSQIFEHFDISQINYEKNFGNLLQSRAEEKINHADFMTNLISQGRDEVHAQITTYEKLIASQDAMNAKIDGQQEKTDEALPKPDPSYRAVANDIGQQIDNLQTGLTEERTKFENHKKDIRNFIDEKLAAYYGTAAKSKITLGQFLDKADNKDLEITEKSIEAQLVTAISELPEEDFSGKEFSGFGISPITIPTLDYSKVRSMGTPSEKTTWTDLKNIEAQAITSTSPVGRTGTKAKVSWNVEPGVTVNSVTYDGNPVVLGQEIELKTGGVFKVVYSVPDTSTSATSSTSPAPTPKTIDISLNDVQAVSAPIDVLNVQKAAVYYGQKVQNIVSSYQKVEALLKAYNTVKQLRNSDVTTALGDIWYEAISSNLKKYEDSLSRPAGATGTDGAKDKVDKALSELTTLKPALEKNMQDILENNKSLDSQIKEQLTLYTKLKNQLDEMVAKQADSNAAFTKTDSDLTALNSEYTALMAETSGVKASSQSNIKAAESTHETLNNFNRELANAQSTTDKLSQDANSLMEQFNDELTNSGNFVGSFLKVLNNAYENGVPNEVLLKFLSNPVGENSSSVKAAVNVYRPFTWILLLEIVSLFTAYLFATQNIIRKVKNKFKLDKLHETDLVTVTVLSVLSLIIGLVVGVVSEIQLQVDRQFQPSWVLLIVLAAFVLVQGQYFLLKHFRVIGMGISFFMMISFVYLSNAIGTTASLTGFSALIKKLNALSILESQLSGYFDGQPVAIIVFVATIFVIAILIVMNIFIKAGSLWFQVNQTEKV